MLVTVWILCNGHADSLGVKKQVDQKWSIPVVKGLRENFRVVLARKIAAARQAKKEEEKVIGHQLSLVNN